METRAQLDELIHLHEPTSHNLDSGNHLYAPLNATPEPVINTAVKKILNVKKTMSDLQ